MKDQSVSNDFLHYFINKNDLNKISLTLDNVLSILPHVFAQLNLKYDNYQGTSLKSARMLLNCVNEVNIILKKFKENHFC